LDWVPWFSVLGIQSFETEKNYTSHGNHARFFFFVKKRKEKLNILKIIKLEETKNS